MNLFKGFPKNENIPRLSEIGYGAVYKTVRISLFKKLVIVSRNKKSGILLMQEKFDRNSNSLTDTDIIVCECKYDDIEILSLSKDGFCDFLVFLEGKAGIGRVSLDNNSSFPHAEYREILPCLFKLERTNDCANIIQFSIDDDHVRYYHTSTHELSSPYTLIQSSELFITCFDHDKEEVSFVHNRTNKIIFKGNAYFCKFVAHYKEGEVHMLDYSGKLFLVFCNDETARAYVTDEFDDIRAEVIWNKYFNFLTRVFYKRNSEWHTLSPIEDFISQRDISKLTKMYDNVILSKKGV